MAQSEPLCPSLSFDAALARGAALRAQLSAAGLFADQILHESDSHIPAGATWRISPCPFLISQEQLAFFTALGPQLLSFYRALNRLYMDSVKGGQPAWVARYLDQGKPEGLIMFSRMKRFRDDLPAVIRPDVIPTQDGMVITELDSVPGGIGLTAAMSRFYGDLHGPSSDAYRLVGGPEGMVRGFASMLRAARGEHQGCIAIVVSEEAKDYRPEMTWLAARLRDAGLTAFCVEPREVHFTEEGLRLRTEDGDQAVGLIYRFYELFDLLNIPKAELIQYAVKKGLVAVTPPYKPALEEKSAFALLHHPLLRPFWERELGAASLLHFTSVMPRTWLLDPAPIPPSATIPDLQVGGRAVGSWEPLQQAGQKERHFVIKPSGFSELAWGSRGVSVGHDMPQTEWAAALQTALASFSHTPYVLQEFHKGRLFDVEYVDEPSQSLIRMAGRARLSPYYFVLDGRVELAGILATVCPADKKILHGMRDAVMVPCAVRTT
ncbi:hypothetical protein [Nitrospira moscoviensis]|uniref:Glutathionylspermidine synthase pre-ATP-grasp-like domain-containing protein n=1 Tax=Nitrospira moscoviensis TaxID=42253 RepID=A0A0K2GHR0_NITMO|nr:hypothetical protein [Nitrospira moscoviensis]ALA60461.1 hypothetical protein NITMOv2_4077 [Nitrospira moscoviensis]